MKMSPVEQTPEEAFRESIKDVIAIAEKLSPLCKTVEEMVGMATLALENDGQLRLLMREVVQAKR